MPNLIFGLCAMVVYGIFSNQVFNYSNNMFLNEPLIKGTILSWWFVGLLLVLIAFILTIIYEAITLKKQGKTLFKRK